MKFILYWNVLNYKYKLNSTIFYIIILVNILLWNSCYCEKEKPMYSRKEEYYDPVSVQIMLNTLEHENFQSSSHSVWKEMRERLKFQKENQNKGYPFSIKR